MRKKHKRITRREAVKGIVAACVIGGANAVSAETKPASAPATTEASDFSADDVAAADRVAGRTYTPQQQKQMMGILQTRRKKYLELRKLAIDPNVEPAIRFDPRLPETVVPSGASSLNVSQNIEEPSKEELSFASVLQLSRLVRSRKITSTELTKLYLARLKEIGSKLLCVVTLMENRALREAARADEEIAAGKYRGPLHGIPYGAKDLLSAKGAPTSWGVSPYKDRTFDYDATVIAKLEQAGAVLLAKLSLGELAMGDVWFGGMTRNPWKISEGSGGSSAGPGAAVAAGLVGFAIGSETLGSIVSPCVNCGVTGLRPTWGRVSRFGAMPLCRSMDKLGPMTRCVEDCAIILHAIHGGDPHDTTAIDAPFSWSASGDIKSLRVGVDHAAFDSLKAKKYDNIRQTYADTLEAIKKRIGNELLLVTLPPTTNYSGLASLTIAAEAACNFTELVNSKLIDELVQQDEGSWPNVFRAGTTIPASDYLRAQQVRAMLQRDMHDAMRDIDLFLTIPFVGPQSSYTNLTGHPSVVTRCGFVDDRPKMIEIIGQLYREDQILLLAHALERELKIQSNHPEI
jgi:Asp-tRNA(Asn)/Glu-tRNA(Gln) amidotransferase A subunit family amidase